MRTSTFAVAIVVAANLVSSASAEDDFSALLADLTFTDAPAAAEPLAMVPTKPAEELKPVPSFELPAAASAAVDVFEMIESGDGESVPSNSRVALQDPVPSSPFPPTAPSAPASKIDLNAAFALQAPAAALPSQVVGHRLHATGSSCQGCDQPTNCGNGIVCRPRTDVKLPSSTLLQYFRSDPCYTNVWDGYHRKCFHHDHIHGTCDCFNRRPKADCGEVIECAPCTSCNATCD